MLAISVPSPPRLVPITRAVPLSVKAESSIAAGTLLIICEARIAVRVTFFSMITESVSWIILILPRFPMRTKKNMNVSSRP